MIDAPPIASDIQLSAPGPGALLDIVGHLGSALIQSDKIDDPTMIGDLQSAHRLALDLYSSSTGSRHYHPVGAWACDELQH